MSPFYTQKEILLLFTDHTGPIKLLKKKSPKLVNYADSAELKATKCEKKPHKIS